MDAVRLDISSRATEALRKSEVPKTPSIDATQQTGAKSFGAQLADAIGSTDALVRQAEHQASELAAGRGDSVDTIIAVSKADLAMRHVVTLRNRALEAYQEIMRLPL